MSTIRDRERGSERGSERGNEIGSERGVNFAVYPGDRVLIAGPSGAGKSSLLRAVSGLWELGRGKVIWNTNSNNSYSNSNSGNSKSNSFSRDSRIRPGGIRTPNGVFFLPQKPYNLLGSLRQQIAYPGFCPDDVNEEGVQDNHPYNTHPTTTSTSTTTATAIAATAAVSDDDLELLDTLRKVRLGSLAVRMGMGDECAGLGVHRDWSKVLHRSDT